MPWPVPHYLYFNRTYCKVIIGGFVSPHEGLLCSLSRETTYITLSYTIWYSLYVYLMYSMEISENMCTVGTFQKIAPPAKPKTGARNYTPLSSVVGDTQYIYS